jgi:hypothetical protein
MAYDEEHAIQLALYDVQAKGHNIRKENINEVFVMGGHDEPIGTISRDKNYGR